MSYSHELTTSSHTDHGGNERSDSPSQGSNYKPIRSPNADLILDIWNEKRGKLVGGKEPELLFIRIPDPNINIQTLSRQVFTSIKALPIETAYHWSLNWGRTWVALGFDDLTIDYLHTESDEAKKRIILHTDKTISPQSRLTENPHSHKYFFAISNEPCTIEGLALQIERMTDELIWCLGLKYRKNIDDPVEAYRHALTELDREGYDIYVLEEDQIIKLRRNDKRYAVRIYGNVLEKNSVTEIIGTVGPLEDCEKPKCLPVIAEIPAQPQNITRKESPFLRDNVILDMGICVLKRPHIGHMLLAGVVEIARRSLSEGTPVIIHANDTGTRTIQTVAHISDILGVGPNEVLTMISSGSITSEKLESYYQNRHLAKRGAIARTTELVKSQTSIFKNQATEHLAVFESFWGHPATIVPESDVSLEFSPHERLNDPRWRGYGISYAQIDGKIFLLQSDGLLTASATRAKVMHYASVVHSANKHVYIDGDRSITDAISILKQDIGVDGIQYFGAAMGFGFEICSGTDGNSVMMRQFMEQYTVANPQGSLLEDVIYLLNTRYQLVSPNCLPFFDYASPEAFFLDLVNISSERELFYERAAGTIRYIESLKSPETSGIEFRNISSKRKKRLDHLVAVVFRSKDKGILPEMIFLKQEALLETPEVQSLVARRISMENLAQEEARILVLTQIANGQVTLRSNVVDELQRHGYQGDSLIDAIHKLVKNQYALNRINNILFQQKINIEEIVLNARAIDPRTADRLIQRYRFIISTLFKKYL